MSSKGQGLSLNTIVIAAIVLVVLLILVGMTTGYFGKWGPKFGSVTSTSCSEKGGIPTTGSCSPPEREASGFYDDVKEGQKCCLKTCIAEFGGECKNTCPSDKRMETGDWECKKYVLSMPLCCKK